MHFLGIDAGASATQWALIGQEGLVASGTAAAMDGHIYRPSSSERMQQVLNEISTQVKQYKLAGAYMGITGVTSDGSIETLAEGILGVSIKVVSDIELAYRANFAEGEGILLYAGTGSVAFAIDNLSNSHQIGGWGYLLGDEGAGYWIGREAIRHAMFEIEAKADFDSKSLSSEVLNVIGGKDWNSVKSFVYSQERSVIASLSKLVDTAANEGDIDALNIIRKAADHLAYLVKRIDDSLTEASLPVKFTGGISRSTILYQELEQILPKRISISTIDIAQRAAQLAG
jgi:N-acetylglucosamine kinase-like BadF-type ATPase